MIERHEYDAPEPGAPADPFEVPYADSHSPRTLAHDPERDQLHALLDRLLTVSKLAKTLRVRIERLHEVLSGREKVVDVELAAKVTEALAKIAKAAQPKKPKRARKETTPA